MQKIAVFDFDGTVYKKDSLIEFCLFVYRKHPWRLRYGFVQMSAWFLHKIKLLDTLSYKDFFLVYLNGFSTPELNKLIHEFWEQEFPQRFNKQVMSYLDQYSSNDQVDCVCVSASPDFMFPALQTKLNFAKFVCTKSNFSSKKIKLVGKNCRAEEKLERLKTEYPEGFFLEFAISDNNDDDNLLFKANKAYKVIDGQINLVSNVEQ